MKKLWTTPEIWSGPGDTEDLSKRWYVKYSYRDPETGKLKPFRVYQDINRIHTLKGRREAAFNLKKVVEDLLKEGFSPFQPFRDKTSHLEKVPEVTVHTDNRLIRNLRKALDFKEGYLVESSFSSYRSHVNQLIEYLRKNKKARIGTNEFTRAMAFEYMSWVQNKSGSNQTYNNHLTDLSSTWEILVNNMDCAKVNIFKPMKPLPVKPQKNRPFTDEQIQELKEYFQLNDQYLYKFLRFVAYSFLRPIDVVRIKVKNIDLKSGTFYVDTKSKRDKRRRLITGLAEMVEDMILQFDPAPEDYLFGKKGGPGPWDSKEESRRDKFGKRFKKIKRIHGYGREYGMYSLRHNGALSLFQGKMEEVGDANEAKRLMLPYTGHGSVAALEAYLRDYQVILPEDHSDYIKLNF